MDYLLAFIEPNLVLAFDPNIRENILRQAAQFNMELNIIDKPDVLIARVGEQQAKEFLSLVLPEQSRIGWNPFSTCIFSDLAQKASLTKAELDLFAKAVHSEARIEKTSFHKARNRVICKPQYCQPRKKS